MCWPVRKPARAGQQSRSEFDRELAALRAIRDGDGLQPMLDQGAPARDLLRIADLVAQGYDLSLNRYKEIVHDEIEHRAPLDIVADIETLQDDIAKGLADLKAMLS